MIRTSYNLSTREGVVAPGRFFKLQIRENQKGLKVKTPLKGAANIPLPDSYLANPVDHSA